MLTEKEIFAEIFDKDGNYNRENANKYTAILELDKKLTNRDIPHKLIEFIDGWQILYYDSEGIVVGDAIEHIYSYGHKQNLIEVYGFNLNQPVGFLTADEALIYFQIAHKQEVANE